FLVLLCSIRVKLFCDKIKSYFKEKLMQSKKFSIGIDIGGTNTTFGIVNRKGEVVFQATLATAQYPGPEELLRSVHQHLSASIQQLGIAEFIGLGIGAPGANYYTGEITAAANLKWTLPVALQQIASS